ncbi:MAG: 30S ribosomal protein S18 [Anaerolineae bacterium]|nr:30S ribosomal protein S18 [Anaerolineae bacterium]
MENQQRSSSGGPRGPRTGDRGGRDGGRDGQQRRFGPPMRRVCIYCKDKNKFIDYKNAEQLRRYLTDRGKIRPRRKIGTCARHQRELSLAIKRARQLALLPLSPEHVRGMNN